MIDESIASLFWSRISKGHGPNDCWFLTQGGDRKHKSAVMYGSLHVTFSVGKFRKPAHRLANELTYGPIPEGAIIRHRCANGGCCNPSHHLRGTPRENSLDMAARRRAGIKRGELATYEDLPDFVEH